MYPFPHEGSELQPSSRAENIVGRVFCLLPLGRGAASISPEPLHSRRLGNAERTAPESSSALPEYYGRAFGIDGAVEVIALRILATSGKQEFGLRFGLDAFGN